LNKTNTQKRGKDGDREKDGEREDVVTAVTSEVLAEVRSGGTSRDAGVTLASLGLSLVNNLRMGRKESGRRGNEKGRGRGGEWEEDKT
jgi:hypothetical protein